MPTLARAQRRRPSPHGKKPSSAMPLGVTRLWVGRCMASEARRAQDGPLLTCHPTFSTRITSRAVESSPPPPLGMSNLTWTWRGAE
eukprot:scaffold72298_cov27-Phaeocystis_antarctica.AAC.1